MHNIIASPAHPPPTGASTRTRPEVLAMSTRPANLTPAGYCPHCSYAMDPGTCPECGRDGPHPAPEPRRLGPRIRRALPWIAAAVIAVLAWNYGPRNAFFYLTPRESLVSMWHSSGRFSRTAYLTIRAQRAATGK